MVTAHLIHPFDVLPTPPAEELEEHRAFGRLISAAVISTRFCRVLLEDPAQAVRLGFNGEQFGLSASAQSLVGAIEASSLAEFASALEQIRLSGPFSPPPLPVGRIASVYMTPADRLIPP